MLDDLISTLLPYFGDGNYTDIEAPLGIGPCFGSTVVVRELSVITD